MSLILPKLSLLFQGLLFCTLTNTSQHTQTYCILSQYSLCTVSGVYHRPPGTLLCEKRSQCRGILYSIDGAVFLLGSENKVSPDAQWSVGGSIDAERFISSGFHWRNTHWCVRAAAVVDLTRRRYRPILSCCIKDDGNRHIPIHTRFCICTSI